MANKRQYSTTHSSSLMFPAAVENVILNKWATLWLLDYEASTESQTITCRKLQVLSIEHRVPAILIFTVLKAKGKRRLLEKILSHRHKGTESLLRKPAEIKSNFHTKFLIVESLTHFNCHTQNFLTSWTTSSYLNSNLVFYEIFVCFTF